MDVDALGGSRTDRDGRGLGRDQVEQGRQEPVAPAGSP